MTDDYWQAVQDVARFGGGMSWQDELRKTDGPKPIFGLNPSRETIEPTRHDWEPGDATHPGCTAPLCRICGRPRDDTVVHSR